MRKVIIILPFIIIAEIVWAVVCGFHGEWERMATAIGYTFLYVTLLFSMTSVMARNNVIYRLTEHAKDLMREMRTDHANGEKVIKHYMKENARLMTENKKLLAQLDRLKSIHHLQIENNEETLNVD